MVEGRVEIEFNAILARTQSRIRAFIAGMGAAAHEVDDLAQDVYLEFYRNFDKWPRDIAAERWLKGIARNICQSHFRRTSRHGRLQRAVLAEILARTEGRMDRLMGGHPVSSALEECVAKLSSDQRKLIEMRYQQDLTSVTIADQLSLTAEAVRVTLYRIRTALKKCIILSVAGRA